MTRSHRSRLIRAVPPSGDNDSPAGLFSAWVLQSGALSPQAAVGALAGQLLLGLVVLLQMNDYNKVLGASSLLLVGMYPS